MKKGKGIKVSDHAKQRIKERVGLQDRNKIKEWVRLGYVRGMSNKDYYIPKDTFKWINEVIAKYHGRCKIYRMYDNYLLLFSKDLTLVTVLNIPRKLVVKNKMERRQIGIDF